MSRFSAFATEWGKPITITSGFRNDREQAELWVRANKFKEPGIYTPALPENETKITYKGQEFTVPGSGHKSSHAGQALDISSMGIGPAPTIIDAILSKHGLVRPFMKNDPVHVQTSAAEGAVLSGPSSGYKPNLTMHGTEAIIPLKNESVPVEITTDSTVGQTLVSLNSLMQQLLEMNAASVGLLQSIERTNSNTAVATEKTARYASN